jgi:hypothetical protein
MNGPAGVPYITIVLPFEGAPRVQLWAESWESQIRMVDWLNARPRLAALYNDVIELTTSIPAATAVAA